MRRKVVANCAIRCCTHEKRLSVQPRFAAAIVVTCFKASFDSTPQDDARTGRTPMAITAAHTKTAAVLGFPPSQTSARPSCT